MTFFTQSLLSLYFCWTGCLSVSSVPLLSRGLCFICWHWAAFYLSVFAGSKRYNNARSVTKFALFFLSWTVNRRSGWYCISHRSLPKVWSSCVWRAVIWVRSIWVYLEPAGGRVHWLMLRFFACHWQCFAFCLSMNVIFHWCLAILLCLCFCLWGTYFSKITVTSKNSRGAQFITSLVETLQVAGLSLQ